MVKRNPLIVGAAAAILAVGIALPGVVSADPLHDAHLDESRPTGAAMMFDALFARPVYLVATALGTGFFVISAPFSLSGGNAVQTWDMMVGMPARNAFTRCLGCTPVQDDRARTDRRLANAQADADKPVPETSN